MLEKRLLQQYQDIFNWNALAILYGEKPEFLRSHLFSTQLKDSNPRKEGKFVQLARRIIKDFNLTEKKGEL